MTFGKLKRPKSPVIDQIAAEFINAGRRTFEVRERLLSFRTELFVFGFDIEIYKD